MTFSAGEALICRSVISAVAMTVGVEAGVSEVACKAKGNGCTWWAIVSSVKVMKSLFFCLCQSHQFSRCSWMWGWQRMCDHCLLQCCDDKTWNIFTSARVSRSWSIYKDSNQRWQSVCLSNLAWESKQNLSQLHRHVCQLQQHYQV